MAVSNVPRIGYGTTLSVQASSSSAFGTTTFVAVANVVEPPSGPDATAADVDTHAIDDGVFETHAKGSVNPGTSQFVIRYDPLDDSGKVLAGLLAQVHPIPNWKITFGAVQGSTTAIVEQFAANLMSIGRTMPKNGMIQTTIGLQASGSPGYTT